MWKTVPIVVVALLPLVAVAAEEPLQEWAVVAESGAGVFVYVSPGGLDDKFFVAQVLDSIVKKKGKSKSLQIMMFDDKRFTPRGFPMTDAQMKHQKAQYNFNPNNGHEKFVWVTVTNPNTSPPELKRTEATIRPGYAE